MRDFSPQGYGISGRYHAIADRLGHSDPEAWRQDPIKAGRFPVYRRDGKSNIALAREARAYLKRERDILAGKLITPTMLCKECGSGATPHVCW